MQLTQYSTINAQAAICRAVCWPVFCSLDAMAMHADLKRELSAALGAVLEGPNHHRDDADAQEPTGPV